MLQIKLLHPNAKVPTRANDGDAGLDLYALEDVVILPKQAVQVRTGIAMAIPKGYAGLIMPRSGLAIKLGVSRLAGLVDSGYRNEVIPVLSVIGDTPVAANAGERIAQLVIVPIELWTPQVVDVLDETERGQGGFGSSGR